MFWNSSNTWYFLHSPSLSTSYCASWRLVHIVLSLSLSLSLSLNFPLCLVDTCSYFTLSLSQLHSGHPHLFSLSVYLSLCGVYMYARASSSLYLSLCLCLSLCGVYMCAHLHHFISVSAAHVGSDPPIYQALDCWNWRRLKQLKN